MKPGEIPGYEFIERVGRGGMAEVWKARQLSLDRLVAIKILTHSALPDQEALSRFHTETRAAARLNHQGIVQVYDAGEMNGTPYYVMEFVEGRTVGDLIEEHGRLDWDTSMLIAESVAQGLAHAWEKAGIIHLDVKPDNILMAADGSIKIADLGLARITEALQEEHSDLVLGTPNYTSPEQALGRHDLDCRSDIYSLGAMLYHLLTGVLPFGGSRGSDAMDKQVNAYLTDPLEINPTIPPPAAWLIEKLMVKDRDARIPDWPSVIRDIAAVRAKKMPSDPLPTENASTVRRCSRRKKPVTGPKPVGQIRLPKKPITQIQTPVRSYSPSLVGPLVVLLSLISIGAGMYFQFHGYGFKPGTSAEPVRVEPTNQQTAAQPQPPSPMPVKPPAPVKPVVPVVPPAPRPSPDAGRPAVVTPVAPATAPAQVTAPVKPATPATQVYSEGSDSIKIRWTDAVFEEAVQARNQAFDLYRAYLETRNDPRSLDEAERLAQKAVFRYQACRNRAPTGIPMDELIRECQELRFDIRRLKTN